MSAIEWGSIPFTMRFVHDENRMRMYALFRDREL